MDNTPTRFSNINPSKVRKLVKNKDQKWLSDHGGVEGIVSALETDVENGIPGDRSDIDCRRKTFGHNFFPEYKLGFKYFALKALKNPIIIILLVCSVLSLAFAIASHGLKGEWREGVSNLVVVSLVVAISAGCNFGAVALCLKQSNISSFIPQVDVVRDGKWQQITIPRIVVGDVVFLKPGDLVPADGLFLDGNSFQVENKTPDGKFELVEVNRHENPFLFSGSMVVVGHAKMLVTAVGKHKDNHVIWLNGPLVDEFKNITSVMSKIGGGVALLTYFVFLARFFIAGNVYDGDGNRVSVNGDSKFIDVVSAMVGVTATPAMIALTAYPEGLLFAVKIALAYLIRRLMQAKVLVRKPSVCSSVASVTTICVNKTGTLTSDHKEVTKLWLGVSFIKLEEPKNSIAMDVLKLLHEGIGLNTCQTPSKSSLIAPQNPTENAIFRWAVRQLGMDVETLKNSCAVLETEHFNSKNKQSGVLISRNGDNSIHVHRKGAAEEIIAMCSHYYEPTGAVKAINETAKVVLQQILQGMTETGLRCIAFSHGKAQAAEGMGERTTSLSSSRQQLILLAIVGLSNQRRSGMSRTMRECQRAGLKFKLLTGDNMSTARAVAVECGILGSRHQPEELVQGEVFRSYTSEERMEKVESIRVMARASPLDKFLMVQSLKQKGHVVAYLGRGVGDAQALREADVGICFGLKSAETMKSSSPIFTWNKDFPLVLETLRWGRSIYNIIQIYTQFLLTATSVALAIDFVTTIFSSEPPGLNAAAAISTGQVPFPVFQVLWVKLTFGSFVALALGLKKPSEELLHKPPKGKNKRVMTNTMLMNVCAQVVYQTIILLTIHFKGESIFKVNCREKGTIMLNTYILCQVFAMFNSRQLLDKSMFEEMRKKRLIWGLIFVIIAVQILIAEVLKRFEGVASLEWGKWGVCACIAAISLPINWLVKCICFSSLDSLKGKPKIE